MIRIIFLYCLLSVAVFAQEWKQISGPTVTLQTAQTAKFIVPPLYQFDEILISYKQIVNGQFSEDFVNIPLMPSIISGEAFYGMRIDAIKGGKYAFEVTTTGATYKISKNSVDLIRRIDPAINEINPKIVARITFNDVGKLSVEQADSERCTIVGEQLSFEIYSDSAMLITHHSDAPFSYTYQNLLVDAPQKVGPGTERLWTDGYGGSLHARNPIHTGPYSSSSVTEDSFTITLEAGAGSVIAVFPPKKFDFEALYGANTRPHVWFAGSNLTYTLDNLDDIKNKGFGVIMPWASLYNGKMLGLVDRGEKPIWDEDESGNRTNYRYEWKDPVAIQNAINQFHLAGFKVIPYFSGYWWSLVTSKTEALTFMRNFQATYNLDGWYFDNAGIGGSNWFDSYIFMKQVRRDVGDDGIIYHHDSVDIWAGLARDGRVFVPADAYANYTLKGETGSLSIIHTPNDPYLRYYTSGYGFAQTIGAHKLASNGKPSLERIDLRRSTAQNYNGSSRSSATWSHRYAWDTYYLPHYLRRQTEYLSGSFSPNISWPIDWWFDPTNVLVNVTENSATVSWTTHLPANSNVRHTTIEEHYFRIPGITKSESVTDHSIAIQNLIPGQQYEYAIRSTDGDNVWGYYGTFTVSTPE